MPILATKRGLVCAVAETLEVRRGMLVSHYEWSLAVDALAQATGEGAICPLSLRHPILPFLGLNLRLQVRSHRPPKVSKHH